MATRRIEDIELPLPGWRTLLLLAAFCAFVALLTLFAEWLQGSLP